MSLQDLYKFSERNAYANLNFEERDATFWKSLGNPCPWEDPIYGADMLGSLFGEDHASSWNVNNLDSLLSLLGSDVPGVTKSYLYIGTWRAMFAFHTEDLNLYSINYLHTGNPKVRTFLLSV